MLAKKQIISIFVSILFVWLLVVPAVAGKGRSHAGTGRSAGIGSRTGHSRGRSGAHFQRGAHPGSRIGNRRGIRPGSRIGNRRGIHAGSRVGNRRGIHAGSRIGHNRALRPGSRIGHNRALRPGSRIGHNRALRPGSRIGHNRRHNYLYFSLPYYRYYYGYPYYYFSLPYYRYYYPYPPYYGAPYPQDAYQYAPDRTVAPQYDTSDPYRDARERIEREKIAQKAEEAMKKAEQAQKTAEETKKAVEYVKVDQHLQSVAEAFAAGDYAKAVQKAQEALEAQPDNTLLPFVYIQSLFANQSYTEAASVLREALRKTDVDKDGVFFPRGFYPDEQTLTNQIAGLTQAAQAQPSKADLQLLLGYQLLGVGKYDDALKALHKAHYDYVNKDAAELLVTVLEKTRQASD